MKVRLLHVALVALSLFNIFSLDASDVVLAINAGGSAYTSSFGFSYSSDVYYTSGLSNNAVAGAHVAHTLDENIYLSERSDSVTWGYDIPISTDGKYVLILQFAEISFSSANSRVFTIQVGDYLVANHLDLVATVGGLTAYDIFIPFILSSNSISINGNLINGAYSGGKLVIRLYVITDKPKLSGIILVSGDCSVADNCNMCYQAKCSVCNLATWKCTTCINNATKNSSGVCDCKTGNIWVASSRKCVTCDKLCASCSVDFICATCVGANVLVSNVCLRGCPYGFGSPCATVSTPVIDQNFADYFYGAYGLFKTGSSSSSYNFFNTPEIVDPIPVKNRGLYFSWYSYLETTSSVCISFNFSIGMWIFISTSLGDIFSNSFGYTISISVIGAMTILLEDKNEGKIRVTTSSLSPPRSTWLYFSFVTSFSSSTVSTTIVSYLNNSPQASKTSSGYIFRDTCNNVLLLGEKRSGTFLGYIYHFTLWNVAVSNFNTQYSDQICGSGARANCLWECGINQWINGGNPTNCNSCSKGCVRNLSCNVCDDTLCSICTGFLAGLCIKCVTNASGAPCACNAGYYLDPLVGECKKCISNNPGISCACNIGYYWDSTAANCAQCDYSCTTCTSSSPGDCIACASGFYMYLGWCISKCPDGFIESGPTCVENDPFIFYLSFDTLEGAVLDKQSKIPALTGNSTAFYPDYDDFDPIAALYRGFYFNGLNSLMHLPIYPGYSSPVLSFGYSFTFSIWINTEDGFETIALSTKRRTIIARIICFKLPLMASFTHYWAWVPSKIIVTLAVCSVWSTRNTFKAGLFCIIIAGCTLLASTKIAKFTGISTTMALTATLGAFIILWANPVLIN